LVDAPCEYEAAEHDDNAEGDPAGHSRSNK
jgi:hypothetical protein